MTMLRPFLVVFLFVAALSASGADTKGTNPVSIGEDGIWWGVDYRQPANAPESKTLPLISVQGNRFVDPDGKPVLFRGVSIIDPDLLEADGRWKRRLFEEVAAFGADIVRVPIHPAAWRRRGTDDYLKLLDETVKWCTELGMYVIIDWHSIGNLKMELFQHPMYNTTHQETHEFWRTIARHFTGHNTVAFYEIFNEPTMFRGQLGKITWTEWKEMNEDIITVIRYSDKETIPLVAGFDWAYDLNHLRYEPIEADGIGYVTHPYPNKRTRPWEPKWEENFAFAAQYYPLIATEIGFDAEDGEVIDDDHYGNRITRFLESRGISWVAWAFDHDWHPQMLKDTEFNPTVSGQFFKEAMQRPVTPLQGSAEIDESTGPNQID